MLGAENTVPLGLRARLGDANFALSVGAPHTWVDWQILI